MITNCVGLAARLLSMFCLVFFAALPVSAQEVQSAPEVIDEDYHDTSIPVRDMTPVAAPDGSRRVLVPLRRRPGPPIISSEPDAVSQNLEHSPLVNTTNELNFDGVPIRDGIAPPDSNASVGATQIVEVVNISYQVFSKSTGHSVFGPAEISHIFSGFAGVCGSGPDYNDPIVLYDKAAGRWLVTILASSDGFKTGLECIAVSATSDATGSYHRYAFSFQPNLNDYPKFGVWPDAYYGSYNMFNASKVFLRAEVCAYPRGAMLAGNAAPSICFQRGATDFTLLPSDLDGQTSPPAGEPNFFLELATSSALNLFKFHVNFMTTAESTFTGPTRLTVPSFTEACAPTGTSIPQPGTTQRLDSLGDRMMFRLAYRKFAGHEALVATTP